MDHSMTEAEERLIRLITADDAVIEDSFIKEAIEAVRDEREKVALSKCKNEVERLRASWAKLQQFKRDLGDEVRAIAEKAGVPEGVIWPLVRGTKNG